MNYFIYYSVLSVLLMIPSMQCMDRNYQENLVGIATSEGVAKEHKDRWIKDRMIENRLLSCSPYVQMLRNLKTLPSKIQRSIILLLLKDPLSCNFKLSKIFGGHTHWISSVAFSPNEKKILIGSLDKTARLWDTETGVCLKEFRGHTNEIHSVAFSPDGTKVLTGSSDTIARLRDVKTGVCLTELRGHTSAVTSVAFSPDGTKVLTGSYDTTARLWDVETGICLTKLRGHTNAVTSVAFSPNGTKVLTGSGDNTARLWDVEARVCLTELEDHTEWITSVAFSPDGEKVLIGSCNKTVCLWDLSCETYKWFLDKADSNQALLVVLASKAKRAGKWLVITDKHSFEYKAFNSLPKDAQEYLRKWYSLKCTVPFHYINSAT